MNRLKSVGNLVKKFSCAHGLRAWIGYVRLGENEDRIHSGQIGVMVGNELRLYQIGARKVS